ncbi:hypothetical protein LTR56_017525 [Elasticomyces elasticus]|nr:hypothetical protein LTR56_017525 [Elasticomyces elasticus]KAK3665075.1 hypothetical protein LTR22_004131 [Elasticomyces elasticus]KAK4931551.1 hypothetical protein LTR49_001939 [Elasticomyces elasticus]KAK5766711.1 hypothetical protein LTS12_003060 [Elasticomyces elasticus]
MIPLIWNEALSGITGSISLAAWVFLLLPQLLENYQQGSAEGISLSFLLIWFVGDVTNLAGAIWAGLVPTVTALAIYFCFADAILIGQCLFYRSANKNKTHPSTTSPDERTTLLNSTTNGATSTKKPRQNSTSSIPGSLTRTRTTSSSTPANYTTHNLSAIPEEKSTSKTRTYAKNTLSVFLILAVGTAGWAIAYKTGAWRPQPTGRHEETDEGTPLGASILGYASAVCYLGARIPQILKNQRERSCEGLSLLFFVLSVVGNATYGAGILFHSLERGYVLTNLPWLIGSLGTMVEDGVIFAQFSAFGERKEEVEEGGSAVV